MVLMRSRKVIVMRRLQLLVVGFVCCPIVAGCVQVPKTGDTTVWKDHFVVANKRGEAENQIFDDDDQCSLKNISQIEDDLEKEKEERLCQIDRVLATFNLHLKRALELDKVIRPVIFIHGGLNEVHHGIERVHRDLTYICSYDPERPGRGAVRDFELCEHEGNLYYPIFLNWHSGFWSSYWDQIYNVRGGERIDRSDWKWVHHALTPAYVLGDLLTIVATAPAHWAYQGYRFFSKFDEAGSVKEPEGAEQPGNPDEPCSVPCVLVGEEVPLGAQARLLENVVFAVKAPAKMLSAPAVDVLGKRAWLNMRRRTQAVFWTQEDFDQLDGVPPFVDNAGLLPGGKGVFATFLRELQSIICEDEIGACRRHRPGVGGVVLVAHSMGTMIANRMIREHDLGYEHIVYMAAADSITESFGSVIPYLKKNLTEVVDDVSASSVDIALVEPAMGANESTKMTGRVAPQAKFYNMMLSPIYDAWEDTAHVVPSGSLLEWIDSMYQSADSDMDRTFGKWTNARRAVHLPDKDARVHVVLRIFGTGDGDPRTHGQFDDLPWWRPSCWSHSEIEDLPPGMCSRDQEPDMPQR
jgi:hypothetical protein